MTETTERRFIVEPGGTLTGTLEVPGDKSISHRAVMLGAIAEGETAVSGFLDGDDAMATLAALRALGVVIEGPEQGRLRIQGVGLSGLREASGRWIWAIRAPPCACLLACSPVNPSRAD